MATILSVTIIGEATCRSQVDDVIHKASHCPGSELDASAAGTVTLSTPVPCIPTTGPVPWSAAPSTPRSPLLLSIGVGIAPVDKPHRGHTITPWCGAPPNCHRPLPRGPWLSASGRSRRRVFPGVLRQVLHGLLPRLDDRLRRSNALRAVRQQLTSSSWSTTARECVAFSRHQCCQKNTRRSVRNACHALSH